MNLIRILAALLAVGVLVGCEQAAEEPAAPAEEAAEEPMEAVDHRTGSRRRRRSWGSAHDGA